MKVKSPKRRVNDTVQNLDNQGGASIFILGFLDKKACSQRKYSAPIFYACKVSTSQTITNAPGI